MRLYNTESDTRLTDQGTKCFVIAIFTKKETYNSAIRAHRNNATAVGSTCFDNQHQPFQIKVQKLDLARMPQALLPDFID